MPARTLTPGDPAPWFVTPSTSNPRYHFDSVAGRYIALCFFGSAGPPANLQMLRTIWQRRDVFQDDHASFFGVSCDQDDLQLRRIEDHIPGYRLLWDFGRKVSTLYGVCDETPGARAGYRPTTFVLDTNLRVMAVLPIEDPAAHAARLVDFVGGLPPHEPRQPGRLTAPVLLVPHVFEREFCRELIDLYERGESTDSGYMITDNSGKTVAVIDYGRKRRRDYFIQEDDVRARIRASIERRLLPEIQKAFQFRATHIERYIVACYDPVDGGYFRPHRDNTTKGTAHRRFAVTINLNAEDYGGGDLCFPEYGRQTYRAPTGGAIVFSCSLMHEATPVRDGRRYCVLPFLYDETGARIRQANLKYLADDDLKSAARSPAPAPQDAGAEA